MLCLHTAVPSLVSTSALQVRSKSEKLARSEEANAELSRQLAAERKAAQQAGAAGQRQLLGSMRRIQYMVSIITHFVYNRLSLACLCNL